jgi:aerobic-type carbon monoxide dehydrogenase small subunit (CoxS/CutS family)
MGTIKVRLTVNGSEISRQVEASQSLLAFLRQELGLAGTREGCGRGDCGTCTVLLDGKPALSCIMFAFQADGCRITTIEGLSQKEKLDVLQRCFIEKGAVQCGFCTPAMILVGKALLESNPRPSRQEIRQAIAGVLCRCTGYRKIVDAIEEASIRRQGG